MRILIFSAFDPIPSDGAEPVRYARLAEQLLAHGHEVIYITSSFFHLYGKERAASWTAAGSPRGLTLILLNSHSYQSHTGIRRMLSFSQLAKQLAKALKSLGALPDVVLTASPPLMPSQLLLRWAKAEDIPSVLDIQDAWPQAWEQFVPPFLPKKHLLRPWYGMAKENVKLATAVCSVSADYLARYDLHKKPSQVFHLGAFGFSENVAPDAETLKIAYLGNAATNTRLPMAAEVIATMPDCQLDIMGLGKRTEVYRKLEQQYPNTSFSLWENTASLRHALAEHHIGLLLLNPASHIAFPNKAFAYWAAGLPVISNVRGGELEQLIEKNQLGCTLPDDNHTSLAEAIYFCKEHYRQPDRLRIQAFAREQMNSALIYRQYADWLLGIAKDFEYKKRR